MSERDPGPVGDEEYSFSEVDQPGEGRDIYWDDNNL
jgi:hypothetical protein